MFANTLNVLHAGTYGGTYKADGVRIEWDK